MFNEIKAQVLQILKDPKVLFIGGIISKWYFWIIAATLTITYYVFKGLSEAGVFDLFEKLVTSKFTTLTTIARECTPLILHLKELLQCISMIN